MGSKNKVPLLFTVDRDGGVVKSRGLSAFNLNNYQLLPVNSNKI